MTFRHLRNVRGFLSDYYLASVFGRDRARDRAPHATDHARALAYRRLVRLWERAEGRASDRAALRELLARPLLRDVLGFHLGADTDGVHRLYADAEAEARGAPPLALAWIGHWDEDPDTGRGNAAPARRLEAALASAGLGHGLLLTGERLRLVRPPGDGPRGAFLEVDLAGLVTDEDDASFAAVLRLFHAASYLADGGEPAIRAIERESREHGERVSDDLRHAVFTAAETLAGGLMEGARMRGRLDDLAELDDGTLVAYRDAALTALYRILFILYAEARDPRLDQHRLYRDSYSAHGLVDELLRDPTRAWPENRSALWARLRTLFEIYDRGLPVIAPWQHIPPRGGEFFRRDTPEGAILDQARLPDRVVARLLLDLTTTAPRPGVGRERVSFRELDIESLGAVYEGLLEHEPRVAGETMVELRLQGRLLALSGAEAARLCRERRVSLAGDPALVAGTAAEPFLVGGADDEDDDDEDEPDDADDGDDDERPARGRANARLIRRLEAGTFHFVPGPARKGSGSFYTPLPLVRDLVRHALGPLVEDRTPEQIEALRVVDPACGSAHFLVEAMRFLGRALHRAYTETHGRSGPPGFRGTVDQRWDEDWRASDEEARAANSEARAWCKRRIAERVLFGVDANPTAVALARVALWIESLAGDRPLGYFAHHVRCGNALLGTWLDALDRPPLPSMARGGAVIQLGIFSDLLARTVREAAEVRRLIDRAADAAAVEAESLEEQQFKERQRRQAEDLLAGARLLFDLRSASALVPAIWGEWEALTSLSTEPARLAAHVAGRPWREAFEAVRARERFFHWELEFPEALLDPDRAGFDAVLGNPPWDKVLPTRHEFYARHDVLIRAFKGNDLERRIGELHAARPGLAAEFERYRDRTTTIARILRQGGDFPFARAQSQAAHEDVSKYFVDRAARLVGRDGVVGMVVPSVLYNGDGAVGVREFLLREARIERFYGFENRRKVFPIDSRYKFVNLVFRKAPGDGEFDAAFMRHDLGELDDRAPKPWTVRIARAEVERLSPETYALLEYRGPRDQDIVRRMHAGRPTLGGHGPGAWGATFFTDLAHMQIYNGARDKDLWTDPATGRLYTPATVLGREPGDVDETIRRMRERGFWPVFEGKHVDQFLVGIKPIRWWLSVEQAEEKYEHPPRHDAVLVFRETASNTNERTCIAAVLLLRSAGSHTLSGIIPEHVHAEAAATVLNSLCFDYALRMRTAGTHVSFTYVQPVAVPPAEVVNRLPRVPTRPAWSAGISHITEDKSMWPLLWEANRAVAEAYGLDADDFAHILASFDVFARKRPEFHAWLLERIAEWRSGRTARVVYAPADDLPGSLAAEPDTAGAWTSGRGPSSRGRMTSR